MSEPIDVTPDEEFRQRSMRERDEGPEWMAWTWASRGRGFPWLGVLLVLVGVALLIQQVVPGVSAGTLVLLAIGVAFLAGWAFGGSWFSMIPGVLLISLATARLAQELNVFDGPGLTALALGIGFLVIWLLALSTGRRYTWALWAAAIFGLVGLVQVSGRIAGLPDLGAFWPVVIIVIGVVLLLNGRRG